MTYYIKDLEIKCQSCRHRNATKEVLNGMNASLGRYCSQCAKRKLKVLLEQEAEERRGRLNVPSVF